MQTQDIERIRFVTRHYEELQGLRWLMPIGGLLLALGLGESAGGPLLLGIAVVVGASSLGLMVVAKSYYRRTFGEVEKQPNHIPLALAFLCMFGLELFRSPLGIVRCNWIQMGGLLLGLWVFQGLWSQVHYPLLGGLLLGLAAPGPSSAFFLPALRRGGISEILSGTALILAGLLDHREIVRVLGAAQGRAREMEDPDPMEVKR